MFWIWSFLVLGFLGLLLKNNFLFYLIAVELIILAINLAFIEKALITEESLGFFCTLLLLALAAIDTAIGLSLLLSFYHKSLRNSLTISSLTMVKG